MLFVLALLACGDHAGRHEAHRQRDGGADTAAGTEPGPWVGTHEDTGDGEHAGDPDGDGYRTPEDCLEKDATVHPGADDSRCDGVDNDCDGVIDGDAPGRTWYLDADGDGYGGASADPRQACIRPPGWVLAAGDCDDGEPDVHPGAVERCDGRDDDCDGLVDAADPDEDGPATWYVDADGDGWGGAASGTGCSGAAGTVLRSGDCDDASAGRHLGCADGGGLGFEVQAGTPWVRLGQETGDLDGDGDAEVLLDDQHGKHALAWSGTAGGLTAGQAWLDLDLTSYAGGAYVAGVADVDGDERPDLYAIEGGVSNEVPGGVLLFEDLAPGALTPADADFVLEWSEPVALAGVTAGDVDGDGAPDLVTWSYGAVRVFLGPLGGVGAYEAADAVLFDDRGDVLDTVAADLDGDGVDELAIVAQDDLYVVDDVPTGRHDVHDVATVTRDPVRVAVAGDVDGDGVDELVASTSAGFSVVADAARPESWDAPLATWDRGQLEVSGVLDFDGDGAADLVGIDGSSGLRAVVVPGPIAGVLPADAPRALFDPPAGSFAVPLGDVDGDGRDDVGIDNQRIVIGRAL